MKIKQRPEDFSVKESYRFDEVPGGEHRVYLMDKQKLSTFEAIDLIRKRFGLPPGVVSFCGLKDKQGRTEQLVAVEGYDVDLQEPALRLKYLGRADRPLTAANTTSNRFSVTVRQLTDEDLNQLPISSAEVNRLGVVNYFDSQRFGGIKHGQGFIAKDIIRRDFQAALKNYMARPSALDRTGDAKVKAFWRDNWGQWNRKPPMPGNEKYYRILQALRQKPADYLNAFLQIEASYRALLLFEYQSYLWNEGVRRLLATILPREQLFPMPYQAGTLIFHREASAQTLRELRELTFPLLGPESEIRDPRIKSAVDWVLGKEKITLDQLRIPEARNLLFFKHEERPVLIYPQKMVLGRPGRDELNPGYKKLNVAFTLPPGSYATLVIKRLFHFAWLEDIHLTAAEHAAAQAAAEAEAETAGAAVTRPSDRLRPEEAPRAPSRTGTRTAPASRSAPAGRAAPASRGAPVSRAAPAPAATPAPAQKKKEPEKKGGFREAQRQKKAARQKAREETAKQLISKGKPPTKRKS